MRGISSDRLLVPGVLVTGASAESVVRWQHPHRHPPSAMDPCLDDASSRRTGGLVRRLPSDRPVSQSGPRGFEARARVQRTVTRVADNETDMQRRREKMKRTVSLIVLTLTIGALLALSTHASAQAALPADRTVLPIPEPKYKPITDAGRAQCEGASPLRGEGPEGRAQRRDRADRRHRLRPQQRLRRAHPHAHAGEAGERRPEVQPLPHHRAVQPHPHGPADRPQPPCEQRRGDHGTRHGIPRQHRRAPQEHHAAGRDPAPERLQHGRLRQVSRDAALGGLGLRSYRPLAHGFRLRQVLRLHRR